jgi:N-glycosylase/DNA lyase
MKKMKQLIKEINKLKNTPEIKNKINQRIKEFQNIKSEKQIFNELCFCILTANFNAEKTIKIQSKIDFSKLPENKIAKELKKHGHRFPNTRAKYIIQAKKHNLKQILNTLKHNELRDYLVENIKGLGYKEASHFLRNIGYKDYAIIDFHIIDLLTKHSLIKKPKTLTKSKYLEIESTLRKIAKLSKLTLAELDLYLWHLETRKILK